MKPSDFVKWSAAGLEVLRRVLAEAKRRHEAKR